MASRVLGVAREALFAALFGATWLADAYVIAFRIPNLLRDLFAEGALSSAFVPTFAEAFARDGRERAFQIANRVLTGVLLATSLLTAGGRGVRRAAHPPAVGRLPGRGRSGWQLTTQLTRMMMPILALISVSAVFMGMLNSQRRYGAPAYAPALFNVTSICRGRGAVGARDPGRDRHRDLGGRHHRGRRRCRRCASCPACWRLGYRPRLRAAGLAGRSGRGADRAADGPGQHRAGRRCR